MQFSCIVYTNYVLCQLVLCPYAMPCCINAKWLVVLSECRLMEEFDSVFGESAVICAT